jgi:hypothetical protein
MLRAPCSLFRLRRKPENQHGKIVLKTPVGVKPDTDEANVKDYPARARCLSGIVTHSTQENRMASGTLLRRIGILAVAISLTAGMGSKPLFAIDQDKATSAKATGEQKPASKKKTAKQTGATRSAGGATSASGASSMPGFRPDPFTNY